MNRAIEQLHNVGMSRFRMIIELIIKIETALHRQHRLILVDVFLRFLIIRLKQALKDWIDVRGLCYTNTL